MNRGIRVLSSLPIFAAIAVLAGACGEVVPKPAVDQSDKREAAPDPSEIQGRASDDSIADLRKFRLSSEGPYCVGRCFEHTDTTGRTWVECISVKTWDETFGYSPVATDRMTSCANIAQGYADMGKEGDHEIVECSTVNAGMASDGTPILAPKGPCKPLMLEVRPARIRLAPYPIAELPASGDWKQHFGGFINPGAPKKQDPQFTYCGNTSLSMTVTQECNADGTSKPPVYSGSLYNCQQANPTQPVLQWSYMTGTKSTKDVRPDPTDEIICAANMTWAIAGAAAGGMTGGPLGAAAVVGYIAGAGGVVASTPQCIGAFLSDPYGYKEWTPVDNSRAYNLIPPMLSPNTSGHMTHEYKACVRNYLHRWIWGYSSSIYNMEYSYPIGDNGRGYWQKTGEAILTMESAPWYYWTLNEKVNSKHTDACRRESPEFPLGVPAAEWDAMVSPSGGWNSGGDYIYKASGANSIRMCPQPQPTMPPMPIPPGPSPTPSPTSTSTSSYR